MIRFKLQLFIITLVMLNMACSNSSTPSDVEASRVTLGPVVNSDGIGLSIWSPKAEAAQLNIYDSGSGGESLETIDMINDREGIWNVDLPVSYEDKYYSVQVRIAGNWSKERPDLYARAVGVNGMRGMFVDLDKTDPPGWESDIRPELSSIADIILYEIHVRDATIHPSAGVEHPGKYLGLAETTVTPNVGIGHMKDLGVSHVHLLPVFDHNSIDETRHDEPHYNWGYDPLHYNVPEGSFATDPFDGRIRIREFKEMVQAFHQNGLRVVMDVVYNHTAFAEESGFTQIAPGYFYRYDSLGNFSNASACGNETASEKEMVRKYIIESVLYWAEEYHIDGFRFDLMGIHDQQTMNAIVAALKEYDSDIFVYGEGWTAGDSPLAETDQALKKYTYKMPGLAAFSDDIRDGIKGSVFKYKDTGFVSGKDAAKESVKSGIVGATKHPQVDYRLVDYSEAPWAGSPLQSINYVSCHDNHTLYDKLSISCQGCSEELLHKMHKLANGIVLTSQGIPFLHAGVEFLRSKGGDENSFESPDSVNNIVWSDKEKYSDHVNFYRELIAMRKSHPGFKMTSTRQVAERLKFFEDENLIGFTIDTSETGDSWTNITVIYNAGKGVASIDLPPGPWNAAYTEETGFEIAAAVYTGAVEVAPVSMAIFYQ